MDAPREEASAESKADGPMLSQDRPLSRTLYVLGAALLFPFLAVIAYLSTRRVLSESFSGRPTASQTGVLVPQVQGLYNQSISQGSGQIFPQLNSQLFVSPGPLNLPSANYAEILISLAALLLLVVAWRGLRKSRGRTAPFEDLGSLAEDERGRVASILEAAASSLQAGSPYRETVMQCYKMVSRLLEERSDVKGRTLTPREFRVRVVEKLGVDSPHLAQLTSLFEVARYSRQEVTREESREAVACLTGLSALLKQPVLGAGDVK